jgi:hypothetical protein
MEKKNMSIREFMVKFDNGDFNSTDIDVQCEAGWFDWFCKGNTLRNRLYKLVAKLKTIINSKKIDQDKMYLFFKNNCPMVGPTRDDFRICDIETGDVIYTVTPVNKIPTEKIWNHTGKRIQLYKTVSNVWGKENNFEKPLVEGSWNDIKNFFNNDDTSEKKLIPKEHAKKISSMLNTLDVIEMQIKAAEGNNEKMIELFIDYNKQAKKLEQYYGITIVQYMNIATGENY